MAKSPGGPRFATLPIEERDSESNLLLLCANDHIEVDAQPGRYTAEVLRQIKHDHEEWVAEMLSVPIAAKGHDPGTTLAFEMTSGSTLWELLHGAMAWQVASPDDLTETEADLIDDAMQEVVDWGEICADVALQGLRAVRDAKRSLQRVLDELVQLDMVLLAGTRVGKIGGTRLPVAVLEVVRRSELDSQRVGGS